MFQSFRKNLPSFLIPSSVTVPKLLPNLHNVEIGAKISGDHGLLACLRLHGDLSN